MSNGITRQGQGAQVSPFLSFGRLFDDFFTGQGLENASALRPAMDIFEDAEFLTLQTEMPGIPKESVNLTIEDGVLTITGEKRSEFEKKDGSWHRVERRYGQFHRALTLPSGVDTTKAEANFANGVLTVRLPKHEQAKPRKLAIK
jgi:HSP20 family protein